MLLIVLLVRQVAVTISGESSPSTPMLHVAALNVSVHAAETSIETLTERCLPLLLEAADAISADWMMLRTRPQITLNMA